MPTERSRDPIRYALLTAAIVVAAVGGYAGYVVFPRFDLPAVTGAGTLLLAAAAGFAAFFSPCSFPLLATLLARHTGVEGSTARRLGRAAGFAATLALGASVFVLAVGGLFAFGGRGLAGAVTFTSPVGRTIRIVAGVLLLALGAIQADKLAISFRRFEPAVHGALKRQARLRRRHPVAGTAVFGFGYLAAGFGWTGPILAGLAGQALTTGGFSAAVAAFAVTTLVLVLLPFVAALGVAVSQQRLVERLQSSAPTVKHWGGYVLLLVGAWFVVLGIFADTFARLFPV